MSDMHDDRVKRLHERMAEDGVDLAVFSDTDSVVYFSGYANYLAMDFGRATMLVVQRGAAPILITPRQESEMARAMCDLADIRGWDDGRDDEWREPLRQVIAGCRARSIGYEIDKTHPAIARGIEQAAEGAKVVDLTRMVGALRVVKTPEELTIMRQAGKVAVAMVEAGRATIGEGVPEYELALAVIAGGTRKAAEFLADNGADLFVSPTIYNLQIMQSGHHTSMVHRRSSTRRLKRGDPVYFCFCGIANFKHLKMDFDREFWVGSVDDEQARAHETVVAAQAAALAAIRPGVPAEEVHAAAEEVYRAAGHGPAYRTGRAIGYSFLEQPEMKWGDKTLLEAGMTFAVDGGLGVEGRYGARIGDSIAVTESGYEFLTDYPRGLTVL